MSKTIYEGEACKLVKDEDGFFVLELEDPASSLSWNWLKSEVESAEKALEKYEESQ